MSSFANRSIPWLAVLAAGVSSAVAQDGGQLYAMHCSACHAPDGRGATEGAFPPLAMSPWVRGDAELPVKIVLQGMEGPVEVLGRAYNLAMAPQGAALSDAEISAILSYVRSSWGNSSPPVTTEQVAAVREATRERARPWTAEELLRDHPLPLEKAALSGLTSRIYLGPFEPRGEMPDFESLTAAAYEEEQEGLLSVNHGFQRDHFGMVWEAEFQAAMAGEYRFRLDADDAARVWIDGELVVEVAGMGPMDGSRASEAGVRLAAGARKMRVEFVEFEGGEGISLGWRGPDEDDEEVWHWLSEQGRTQLWPNLPIQPADGRAAIYRNFIAGTTPRAIGIGFPGGVNFAYSADHFAPELFWTGRFMDGGRHWTDRGVGDSPPAGERVVKASDAAALGSAAEAADGWPLRPRIEARFRGYRLDDAGNPTFVVEAGGLTVSDAYRASSDALERAISVSGRAEEPLLLLLARGLPVERLEGGGYLLDGRLSLRVRGSGLPRLLADGSLVLPLESGGANVLSYSWSDR